MTAKQLTAALRREYRWRKARYAESETGIRHGRNNCFNETHARTRLDQLEARAEAQDIDWRTIRQKIYDAA